MLTFRKPGWCLLMAVGVGFATIVATNDVAAVSWQSSVERTKLNDGTHLVEYIAETQAVNSSGIHLRTSFIPRFACTPLTTITAIDPVEFSSFPADGGVSALDFFIDGTPTAFPAHIDQSDSMAEAQFIGSLARRVKLRLLLDSGRIASLKTNTQRWDFSLIGSTVVHEKTRADCRRHVPEK